MEKTLLKSVRLLAPGVIVLICVLPYFLLLKNLNAIPEVISNSAPLFIALILGTVYYVLDVRGLLWKKFVQKCHENIKSKMIKPYCQDPTIRKVIHGLTDKEVLRIFYHIIDNDPSLSNQAHDVRMNGAILTTIIDSILITSFFAIMYFVTFFVIHFVSFLWLTIVAVVVQPFLWVLKSRASRKHIDLGNEQLAVIEQLHGDKVRAQLQKLKK